MIRPLAFGGLLIAVLVGGGWFMVTSARPDLAGAFDPRRFGEGVQVYFESIESGVGDITPGVEKRVIWQPGGYERRTPLSVLYLHGFSATSEEIRPVPDRIAQALGANLVYTRLQGHGRDGAALGQASVAGWMADLAEGLAAARAVGDRVVVLSTSTGGTLATVAAVDPDLSRDVAAMIFVSPNYAINQRFAGLLTAPGARIWLPWVLGPERRFDPASADQATYWTNPYPVQALVPMAALVRAVSRLDVTQAPMPALFRISDADQVVQPQATRAIAARWGGGGTLQVVDLGPGDDPSAHVIAGDIMSPGQTNQTVADMLAWLSDQGIE